MDVRVGEVLADRDNRRKNRLVKVLSVTDNEIRVQVIRNASGEVVFNGPISFINRARLPKAYSKVGFAKGGFTNNSEDLGGKVTVNPVKEDQTSLTDLREELKKEIIEEIMKLAEPGNKIILDRLSALEARANASEYGGPGYWKPTVYCDTTPSVVYNVSNNVDPETVTQNTVSAMTGSVVSNYPSVEEVLEKVLPQTESDEFEYLWERLATEGKNPHEATVRMVYKLLTE